MDIVELERPHGASPFSPGDTEQPALRPDARHAHPGTPRRQHRQRRGPRRSLSAMPRPHRWIRSRVARSHLHGSRRSRISSPGFPVPRPSHVLQRRGYERSLQRRGASNASPARRPRQYPRHPVVSQFIEQSPAVEMDAVAQRGEIVAYAISEHIEVCGHLGDATIQLPIFAGNRGCRIKSASSRQIARESDITGPFNIHPDEGQRLSSPCSRPLPLFVSKVLKLNFINRCYAGHAGVCNQAGAKNQLIGFASVWRAPIPSWGRHAL